MGHEAQTTNTVGLYAKNDVLHSALMVGLEQNDRDAGRRTESLVDSKSVTLVPHKQRMTKGSNYGDGTRKETRKKRSSLLCSIVLSYQSISSEKSSLILLNVFDRVKASTPLHKLSLVPTELSWDNVLIQ